MKKQSGLSDGVNQNLNSIIGKPKVRDLGAAPPNAALQVKAAALPFPKMPKPSMATGTSAPFLPKGVAGSKADPRRRFLESATVGNQKGFDQKTDGIKFKPLNQVSGGMKVAAPKLNKRMIQALLEEGVPGLTAAAGAGVAAYNDKSPSSGAAIGGSIGALPFLLKRADEGKKRKAIAATLAEGLPALTAAMGAGLAARRGKSVSAGAALGASLGALPELLSHKKEAFATSQYSGPLSEGAFKARSARGMPSNPPTIKTSDSALMENLKTAAEIAFAAVAWHQKQANITSPKAQLSTAQGGFSKPKMSAPGPSIAQVSKPVGFGKPLPGATKQV